MSLNIACPHCQTRYKIPEKALGKKVKCTSCNKAFSAKAASTATQTKATQTGRKTAASRTGPAPDTLAKMGLGAIRKQPEIFGGPSPAGPDPLRNHVVQDPGFSPGGSSTTNPAAATIDVGNDQVADVVANPFVTEEARQRHKSQFDQDDDFVSGGKGKKKRRNKKQKVHGAVKDSLDKATMTLLIMGVLVALVYGFLFFSVGSESLEMAKWSNEQDVAAGKPALSDDEIKELSDKLTSVQRVIYGIGISLGVVYIGLAFGVQVFPMTCSLVGLILYLGLEIVGIILNPFALFSIWGWAIRVVVCGALGKAFMDSLNARNYYKKMEERGGRRG